MECKTVIVAFFNKSLEILDSFRSGIREKADLDLSEILDSQNSDLIAFLRFFKLKADFIACS